MHFGYLTGILHIQQIGVDVTAINKGIANRIKKSLAKHHITAYDISGSIGCGKTLLIEKLIEKLKGRGIAVIVGDVNASYDADRIKAHGVPVVSVNTGKDCHLDAHRIEHALEQLELEKISILLIENVGNLICPTDFDLGANHRIVVVSATEGDDTIAKQPAIFAGADLTIVNKIDLDQEGNAKKLIADALDAGSQNALKASIKAGHGMERVHAFFK